MDLRRRAPWTPDRAWADPFIATLALLIILAVGGMARMRKTKPALPAERVDLQGTLADVALAAPKVLGGMTGGAVAPRDTLKDLVAKGGKGWDQALLAVHAAEKGDLDLGARLAKEAPGARGAAFLRTWTWAYTGEGPAPTPDDRKQASDGLGNGYAAGMLEARCLTRSGADGKPSQARAEAWVLPRLAALVAAGLAGLVLVLGGLSFMIYLALSRAPQRVLPRYAMSGRALLIVLLGWFLTHISAGFFIGYLLALLPFLKPIGLPLTYAFHATLGTRYLCWAEGITFRELWVRVAPGGHRRALLTSFGYIALAFTMVMAVAMVISPFLRNAEPPQRELMDLLTRLRGPLAVVLTFLTVAGLAPFFEELIFRGFLLPWLGERLETRLGRRGGWLLAIAITGLTFGAMHMQPVGLPTLSTLGIVLGFAFLRTGNLYTAILVHSMWNGGLFLFMRFVG